MAVVNLREKSLVPFSNVTLNKKQEKEKRLAIGQKVSRSPYVAKLAN
jgi:hypothetical protein